MPKVGRPPERDSEGNVISKSLVNVTIPTKLRDFLSKNEINRSKLFTSVVSRMYIYQICPKCYSEEVVNGVMAITCEDCSTVIKYKNCSECNTMYQRPAVTRNNEVIEGNLVVALKGSDKFGCTQCQK